jgi:hypothetical protein
MFVVSIPRQWKAHTACERAIVLALVRNHAMGGVSEQIFFNSEVLRTALF